jgi:glycosyltransferase involved in cell wall biosynthesis
MLRIGFDAKRLFANSTGLGNYSRTLVKDLKTSFPDNELVLFSSKFKINEETNSFFSNDYEIVKGSGPFWRTSRMVSDIKKSDVDVFHGLSHELPIGIQKADCASVVTIHDIIYKFVPSDYQYIDRKIYDFKFKYACKHSNKIIAISQSTKNDIIKYFDIDANKIEVIYQTCSDIFKVNSTKDDVVKVIDKYKLPQQFLLYVGSIIERKQLLQIVKALKSLKGIVKLPLVVVGSGGKYKQTVVEYIKKNNLENTVIFPGFIQNSDLPYLYKAAKIFIYPSIYEGFGIPIIESLYCKTPVITSNLSSLPEAAGGGALYVEPHKPESIAEAIVQLLTNVDLYKSLINNGFDHVQSFNSKLISGQLIKLYERL